MKLSRAMETPIPSPGMLWLESILMCITFGVTVLRLTIVEVPFINQPHIRLFFSAENFSLLLSTVLLACAVLWFLAAILTGRLRWRRTWFGFWVTTYIVAGVITIIFASDKRTAVSELVFLAAPMISAMMLVQWLRSESTLRYALLLILAVGAAATVQCFDQQAESNEMAVAEYETNPAEHLEKIGIEPDSMEHWMYEHRIYSKDIRGFMMTSNSAATFFLMALFAAAGLCLQTISKPITQSRLVALICYVLAGGCVLLGLFLTQSKGGIGAFVLSSILLVLLLVFGKQIRRRGRLFGILVLLLVVAAAGLIINYGLRHDRLPGGNSMLVRWQYWVSTAEMVRDHILTGVGGGNFSVFYMHYKVPAALETVRDPHNWILSLLAQYGPLGLIAFAGAIGTVLVRGLNYDFVKDLKRPVNPSEKNGHLWAGFLTVSLLMLLFIRPMLVDVEFLQQSPDVRTAAYLVLYLFPAGIFVFTYIFLWAATRSEPAVSSRRHDLSIALACGLIAVLVHNLVDFAIFEPGNWLLFWVFAAIIIAEIHNAGENTGSVYTLDPSKRLGLGAGIVLLSIVYLAMALLPPMRAESLFKQFLTGAARKEQVLQNAIAADPLSPKAAYQAAAIYKQTYERHHIKKKDFIDEAIELAPTAVDRNPADFKAWRLLGQINMLLAEQAAEEQKQKYLKVAFDSYQEAVNRYPGSDKLHFDLAGVAEQLGRDDIALCCYQSAVDIEDAYRAQFKIMYPERKTVISRLGEARYTQAKVRIKELSEAPTNDGRH